MNIKIDKQTTTTTTSILDSRSSVECQQQKRHQIDDQSIVRLSSANVKGELVRSTTIERNWLNEFTPAAFIRSIDANVSDGCPFFLFYDKFRLHCASTWYFLWSI